MTLRRIVFSLLSFAVLSVAGLAQTSSSACSAISTGDMGSLNGWVPSPNDAWHQDVSALPVDAKSDTIINTVGDLGGAYLHPDFSNVADGSYGIPYTVVDTSQTTVPMVMFTPYDPYDSDNTLFPMPDNVPIEGTPGQCWNDSADHHAIVLDRATCVAYEVYQADQCNGSWTSYGNVMWDLSLAGGEKRPYGMSSVDAAGLSVFEGLIRYDEIAAGAINHAIRFTAAHTKNDNADGYFTAPAVHAAGNLWGTDNIMGMRIRLKANFDISGFSATNQIILKAMKKYGMILADNGANMFFQGTPDARWNDSDLGALKSIPSSDFEVVQMNPVYDQYSAPTGAAPTINSFTASATTISVGQSVTLTPDVTDGSYEFIDLAGFTRGAITVTPPCTTTYTLSSRNAYNTSSQSVTVNVAGTTAGCNTSTSGSGSTTSSSGTTSGSGTGTTSTSGTQNPNLSINPVNAAVGVPTTLSVTTASTGAVTWYVLGGPATVSGNTLTPTATGSVTLQASQAADPNYVAANAITTVNVAANGTTLSLAPVANTTYGAAPFTVSATSNSPAAITYSVASGPATISGTTVSITGVGTVTLEASQPASGSYAGATALTSFQVSGIAPTINFAPVANQTYGGFAFPVSATSNSTGAITYSVASGPAVMQGNYVSVTGIGTVTLQASQAAAGNYSAGTALTSFTVAAEDPTLGFDPIAIQMYGEPAFAVSITSNSTGTVTYSVVSGPATVSGNMVTVTGTGVVTLQANQAAAGNYKSGTAQTNFTIWPSSNTLSFSPVGNKSYGTAPFPVSASSNSSGAITYSVVSGPATIAGNIVSLTGTGTVMLQANQAAAGAYAAATATTSFAVAAQTPTLTITPIANQNYGAAPFTVSATSNSSGAITYSVASGPATIAGSTLTVTGAGTVTVQASQAAAGAYGAATATASFTVAAQTPTLTIAPIANQTFGAAPFAVSATSNSSGAITFAVLNGPATVAGNTVTLTGSGTVTLQTSQAAAGSYGAATATASFNVSGTGSSLAFVPVANQTVGAAPFVVTATSNSSGAITYSVLSGPATIAGNVVTVTGAGTVTLQASQAAAGGYTASAVSTSFRVSTATATLTFAPIASQTFGVAPFAVSATSNSPGAVTYSIVSGPASIAGNVISVTGVGTVVLQASQAASGNYGAATATASFAVSTAVPTLAFGSVQNQTFGAAPFVVNATSNSPAAITYSVASGPATMTGNMVNLTGAGTVTIQASQPATGNYGAATATASFTVSPASTTLSFAPISNKTFGGAPFAVSASSSSPGAITYSVVSGPATVAGNTVTLTGAGTVVLEASQAAAGSYAAATATTSFTVAPTAPTLAVPIVGTQIYGSAPLTLTTGSNSSGVVTYSVVSGPATVSGNTVALTGVGPVVIQVSQAAAGNYAPATGTIAFPVSASSTDLAITPIPTQTFGNAPVAVTTSSNSPAPVTFTVVSGPATVAGNVVTMTGPGEVVLQASQPAMGGFLAATATSSFTVSPNSVVLSADFAMPNSRTITVTQGASGTVTIPVTAINGFNGLVSFQCAVPAAMAGATCTTSNAQLTNTTAATGSLTITTTPPTVTSASARGQGAGPGVAGGVGVLALLLPCGLPFITRRRMNWKRLALGMVLALSMAGMTLGTTGCGMDIRGLLTQAGTYTLNVNATGGASTHSMTVTVVVQPPPDGPLP